MAPEVLSGGGQGQGPVILATAFPATGHLTPLLQISESLASRGYEIWFVGAPEVGKSIEDAGCTFVEAVGECRKMLNVADLKDYAKAGIENLFFILRTCWVEYIPSCLESIRKGLAEIRKAHPTREVLIMMDVFHPGIVPLKLGADLPDGYVKLPKTLGINIIPPFFGTEDRGPGFLGLPYDNSEPSLLRNALISRLFYALCAHIDADSRKAIESCGVKRPLESLFGEYNNLPRLASEAGLICHDTMLQMCIPSLDYPFDTFPKHFKFGGTLPPKSLNPNYQFPPWYEQIKENSADVSMASYTPSRRKIVTIAQGTVATDYTDVVVPTILGLQDRDDLIIVAILCVKGATLDKEFPNGTPKNTIIVDYFPYDALIQHSDVFVTNGSYGALTHAVAWGVPMVLAGHSEDKPEIGLRGERAGFAVNLRTGSPTPEQLADGVSQILTEPSYKARAMELKKEAEDFKCLDTVERELRALF